MTAANPPVQSAAPAKGLLARHPIVFFFIFAYAGTWLVWMPLVLGAGLLSASASVAIGSFSPFLAALIMTGITEGREGVGRLLRRIVLWRVGLGWYLFAIVGIPAIAVLSVIVLPGALASFEGQGLASLAPLPLLILLVYVLFHGPLGEEPGWRGFALPRLQRLHGPLIGSLILGPLWTLWHLPLFWAPAWNFPPTLLNIVLFVISGTALTIVVTWVFNNTKGSVLIAILVHETFDATFVFLTLLFTAPIVTDYGGTVPVVIGFGAVALLVVVFTRGRLGYDRYLQEEAAEDPTPATARV